MPKSRNPKTGRYESTVDYLITEQVKKISISKWQLHTKIVYFPPDYCRRAHNIYFITRIEGDQTVYHQDSKGNDYNTCSFWEARKKVKFLNDND